MKHITSFPKKGKKNCHQGSKQTTLWDAHGQTTPEPTSYKMSHTKALGRPQTKNAGNTLIYLLIYIFILLLTHDMLYFVAKKPHKATGTQKQREGHLICKTKPLGGTTSPTNTEQNVTRKNVRTRPRFKIRTSFSDETISNILLQCQKTYKNTKLPDQ